jgi:putative ABC transport system permease protein
MTWLSLAARNCTRRRLRTLVTTSGVAIAIAALFSLLAFQKGYQGGLRTELDRLGAHILIVPKGCPYDAASIALHGARWPCYLKSDYLSAVREAYGVGTAAPVFMSAVLTDAGAQGVYVGVDESILSLKKAWRIEGRFPAAPGELLLGADAAANRHLRVGQSVSLPDLKGGPYRVAGVLAPVRGAEDGWVYMRLPDAQRAFAHPKELTHIMVRLRNPDTLEQTVNQLHSCDAGMQMNVVPLAHLFKTIQSLMSSTRILLGAVVLVALLIAGAGVTNTVLMAVAERTREIGLMRALGASRADIFRLFWLETVQVCLAGGIAGITLAFLASRTLDDWLRARLPYAPAEALIRWEWPVAAACVLAGLILGTLAGLPPAWNAARLAPMEAVRAGGGAA